MNLLTNAFYATDEKQQQLLAADGPSSHFEPTVKVSTKLQQLPAGVKTALITIYDNGTGIPQNIINRVFQPFFYHQTHGKRHRTWPEPGL